MFSVLMKFGFLQKVFEMDQNFVSNKVSDIDCFSSLLLLEKELDKDVLFHLLFFICICNPWHVQLDKIKIYVILNNLTNSDLTF